MVAIITRRAPRYTQNLHRARTVARAPSKGPAVCIFLRLAFSTKVDGDSRWPKLWSEMTMLGLSGQLMLSQCTEMYC